ncbi:MAG: uroporphyrinogen decarboxylase family protein [Bacteroidota bacterium]
MKTRKQIFDGLVQGILPEKTLFRPILMHFAARFAGTSYAKFASDYKTLVDCNIRAMEYFDADMVGLISDPYRETSAFGAKITFPDEEVPRRENIIVQSIEDVERLRIPDVYKAERTLDRIKGAELFQKELKGSVPVIGWIEGPLAEACDLAGVSEMLIRLMMDPDFCNFLMDKCMVTAKEFALAQIRAGCDIIGMGDAICSQIDADTYDTFVRDRHIEIINFIHENGGRVKLHICGDITHLLPSVAQLKTDILDLDHMVDMHHARQIVGPEPVLCGNINPVMVQDLTADEVGLRVSDMIRSMTGQRYILSAGCEITVNTPPENLLAMSRAAKAY